jgi:LemA protein
MSSRALSIIERLYGRELRVKEQRGFLRRFADRFRSKKPRKLDPRIIEIVRAQKRLLTARRLTVISAVLLIGFHIALSVYYYNLLTRMEQDVLKEQAKISSLLQRRRNISINLARTVRDYAVHEAEIFRHLADVRAASQGVDNEPLEPMQPATADGAGEHPQALEAEPPAESGQLPDNVLDELNSLIEGGGIGDMTMDGKLARLLAVAERYPDLKLSENFRNFMDALIETEKDLCDERMLYSETVNTYTTKLRTFPGNVFAKTYGFASIPYYEADREAQRFRPVDY